MQPLIPHTPRTPENPLLLAVLVSGNGSNLQAILDASLLPSCLFKVALVISNVKNAFALARAEKHNIPALTINHKDFSSRLEFEQELDRQCKNFQVELVVLAGFMRVLSSYFLQQYPNRVINVHPALCPAFPGTHAPRQALARGVWFTGCTVHLVNEGVDEGPIIAQSVVPVLPNDDEEQLQRRIQAEEHRLLPKVISDVAFGIVQIAGNQITCRKNNY